MSPDRNNSPGSPDDLLAQVETARPRLETWEKERIELTAQRDDYQAKWMLAKHAQMQAELDRDAWEQRARVAEEKLAAILTPRQGEPMPYPLED